MVMKCTSSPKVSTHWRGRHIVCTRLFFQVVRIVTCFRPPRLSGCRDQHKLRWGTGFGTHTTTHIQTFSSGEFLLLPLISQKESSGDILKPWLELKLKPSQTPTHRKQSHNPLFLHKHAQVMDGETIRVHSFVLAFHFDGLSNLLNERAPAGNLQLNWNRFPRR